MEIVLLLLLFFLVENYFLSNKEGFVEVKKEFIRKTGPDIFDNFYVSVYDDLVYSSNKNNYEVKRILGNTKNAKILDIGCGTGHHVNLFDKYDNDVVGIDISPEMIKQAQKNYPKLDFKLADALNSMEFLPDTFTHISCLYFTIYYIKNKKLFFENCFKWLKPHGILVLHLVNMNKFDPVIPVASPFVGVSPQDYAPKRITKSSVKFDILDYKSDFQLNDNTNTDTTLSKPNAIFKEVFKFKNSKKARVNEHNFYMASQKSILALARDTGFILKSQEEMIPVQYKHNYLYFLQKPL